MDEATRSQPKTPRAYKWSKPTHSLSEVDKERLAARCHLCGPDVPVTVDGRGAARCVKGAVEGRARTRRPWVRPPSSPVDREKARLQWAATPPDARRARQLLRKYRLTPAQYEAMYQAVGGKCEICGTPEDLLRVDHDHLTGVVRGLLCHRCNVGIGWLNDSAQRATAAARYLRRTSGLIF